MGVLQDDLILSTGLIMWIGQRKEIQKLTFGTLALRRGEWRNCGLCVVYYTEIWSYAIGWFLATWKTTDWVNYLKEKRLLILWGLRVPIWKINFCFSVLQLSVLPWCRERPQTAICCVEWFGLDAFLSSLSTLQRCSWNWSPSRLPVSPLYNFWQRVQFIQ